MTAALIDVAGLTVAGPDGQIVLDAVTFEARAGEPVAITGPSGAGKTTLGLALLGHVRPGLSVTAGSVRVGGDLILPARAAQVRAARRKVIHYVPQDPLAALTPTMRAGDLLGEALGGRPGRGGAEPSAAGLLRLVGLPADRAFGRRRPHELSGGQRQRLALAMALAGQPAVIVLDEPTAGQDPVSRDRLLGELVRLRRETGVTLVTITHDPVTARALGRISLRLAGGHLLRDVRDACANGEAGLPAPLAFPALRPAGVRPAGGAPAASGPQAASSDRSPGPVLEATGLRAGYGGHDVLLGVDLALHAGQCLGVTGATGSGKTTLIRALTGLNPASGGTVRINGTVADPRVMRRPPAVRRRVGVVFQDPFTSLNPTRRVGRIIAGATGLRGAGAVDTVRRLLAEVGLDPGLAGRYPRELSGGQQQRVAIARALAQGPDVLLGDEVTAALDHATRDGICDLLDALRARRGVALLIVSHDTEVIARLAGNVLELGGGLLAPGPAEGEATTRSG